MESKKMRDQQAARAAQRLAEGVASIQTWQATTAAGRDGSQHAARVR